MTKRTALITGASGGIGYEFAELFAKDGYNLVLVARSTDTLKAIAEDFQSKYHIVAHIVPMNLSSADSPNELFHYLERNNITVDFLVNNAGFGMLGKFNEIELQDELDMIQLNITALTHLTKLFLKGMVARKFGRIMNVASTASFQPGPLMAVYYASKSYVLFLSEALAIELKGTGVTVSALCPGPTNTGFQSRAQMKKTKLFSDSGLVMNAKKVAAIGYKGMLKGKTVIIPGLANKILAQSIRFSPRKLSAEIVRFLQESK